jgi:hypothetical protein
MLMGFCSDRNRSLFGDQMMTREWVFGDGDRWEWGSMMSQSSLWYDHNVNSAKILFGTFSPELPSFIVA